MGEGKIKSFQDHHHHHQRWDIMEESDVHEQQSSIEEETSTISNGSSISCSSFDSTDDASSSYSSSANSSGSSLHDLSDLMSQLPIKRGLSKFYHGKSESFTCLERVKSIEDLPKKVRNPYKKMKGGSSSSSSSSSRRSYGGGLDPKPIISKKLSRASSPFLRQRSFPRSPIIGHHYQNN